MKNGIEIKKTDGGIIISGTQFVTDAEAESVVSEYFFPEFWKDRIMNEGDGELCRDSLFIKSADLPRKCLSDCTELTDSLTLFTYCNNPKFAAGYLKFYVLREILMSPHFAYPDLWDEANIMLKEDYNFRLVDVEEFAEKFKHIDDSDKKDVLKKVLHILHLCNLVFVEKNLETAKKHLFVAANKFNEYFYNACVKINDKLCSYGFEFKVYDGIEDAKNEISKHLRIDDPELENFTSYCLDRKVWGENEKLIVKEALEGII